MGGGKGNRMGLWVVKEKEVTEMSDTVCTCALFVGRKRESGSDKVTGLKVGKVGG